MNEKTTMTVFALTLALSTCCLYGPCQSKTSTTVPAPTQTKQPAKSLDPQVIEVVLQDILAYKGKDAFIEKNNTILFAPDAILGSLRFVCLLEPNKEDKEAIRVWNHLTQTERRAFQNADKSLQERVKIKDGFKGFVPTDKRIKLAQEKKPYNGPDGAEKMHDVLERIYHRPISAFPPGYSEDKQYAVVRLIVPWSIHHADAIYLLAQRDGKWTVLMRRFVYYV